MKRTHVILTALALATAGMVGAGWFAFRSEPAQRHRHVLLITVDTTRADHLGCYGYNRPVSPRIDELAADAVRFDMAIAQASVTPVSHASMLTGLEPYHHELRVLHGMVHNRLGDEQTTLPEVWKAAGGRTAAFVSAFPAGSSFGLDQGFDHFDEKFPQSDGSDLVSAKGMVNTGLSQRRANDTTDAALKWLDDNGNAATPLCLWVHYFDPHDDLLIPPQKFLSQASAVLKPPAPKSKMDYLRAMYDAEILFMDSQIGRLLDAFKRQGLWDDTIVVVVADHGEGLGDHNWWSHGILYQEQIRVPLIVRLPGATTQPRFTSLVRTTDLMPTILEAAGVPQDAWPVMDGESLMSAMKKGRMDMDRFAYTDSVNMMTYGRPDRLMDRKQEKLYCIMDSHHKLIYHQLAPENHEFYDLKADPGEQQNLATSNPPEMQRYMEELVNRNAFSELMPGMTPSSLENSRNLKSLGYVE